MAAYVSLTNTSLEQQAVQPSCQQPLAARQPAKRVRLANQRPKATATVDRPKQETAAEQSFAKRMNSNYEAVDSSQSGWRLEHWSSADGPVEEASTPPSSYYMDPQAFQLETRKVFARNWLAVGHTRQVAGIGDFFTGRLGDVPYLVTRGTDGELHAFHNVCRHHAAAVAHGCGTTQQLQCPYHGWQYDLQGKFRGATRTKGIKNFRAADQALMPIQLDTWGPFIFLNFDPKYQGPGVEEWLATGGQAMHTYGMDNPDFMYAASADYDIDCNWKVYNDNYLDGGYHVPFAHPAFTEALDIDNYHSKLHEVVSFQVSPLAQQEPNSEDPIVRSITENRRAGGGEGPKFAFVYPNFMINKYELWMDTFTTIPLAVDKCRVHFDYYVHRSKADDKEFVQQMIEGENIVQQEDVGLCQEVQKGLQSPAYDVGRYVPSTEFPMFHFHQQVHRDLMR
ncbi:hypothetical protein WJX74_006388 [Apatococcus lobatus]|uniref:Choline monooxygenase, chloroplastic n=1 Tax=Apatococcus lobatus TaxID=904363 RepID=A0AAW1RPL3_9CHLO